MGRDTLQVLLDATGVDRATDGVGRYGVRLVDALARLDDTGCAFSVLAGRAGPGQDALHAVARTHDLPFESLNVGPLGPRRQVGLANHLWRARRRFDVVHSLRTEVAVAAPVPSAVTIHDLKYVRHPEFLVGQGRLKNLYLRATMRATLRRARSVVAVSDSTADDLASTFGIARDEVVVTHLASTMSDVAPADERGPHVPAGPFVLAMGQFVPHKNLARMLDSYAKACHGMDDPPALVVVAPHGGDEAGFLTRARALAVDDRVHVTGSIDEPTLARLYTDAEAFLFASLYEGFGLPVLEAMERGTPVVTSAGTATAEVAGDAAVLVDPRSTDDIARGLAGVLNDPARAAELRRRAAKRVAGFTWSRTAAATLPAYEAAVAQRPKGRA